MAYAAVWAQEARDGGDAPGCVRDFVPAGGGHRFARHPAPAASGPVTVGRVRITRLPIFDESDPREDRPLFRWANRVHVMTREGTVRRQLLFAPGERIPPRRLEESARLLREQGYFYDAEVRPASLCGEVMDVEVVTRDSWSLTPSAAFDRSGGENAWRFGLRDANLLGRGKLLAFVTGSDTERDSDRLVYEDRNVLGGRVRGRAELADSDDGRTRSLDLGLPFFSLDSLRAWRLYAARERRRDRQYRESEEVSAVERDIRETSLEFGFSRGLEDGRTLRWSAGYRRRIDRYRPGPELPPPAPMPADRELSHPFARFESVEDRYATAYNLDRIQRIEDLHVGRALTVELGYAARALGSDADRVVFGGRYRDTLRFTGDSWWTHGLEWEGLLDVEGGGWEDVLLRYRMRWFARQSERRAFSASLRGAYSRNLNPARQVVMGGMSGARAYDNRFQTGDRSVLLTLEQRLYSDVYILNLIRLGGALFVDVGRAWDPDDADGTSRPWLADAGFGLRLASDKAASGRIAHLDFAFPLSARGHEKVGGMQVVLNVRGTF